MARTAFITGINGQDGAYLARLLLEEGCRVVGAARRASGARRARLEELGIADAVEIIDLDLFEAGNVLRALERARPDEVYNLAAQSFVAVSFEQPLYTAEIDALGPVRILEALRQLGGGIRFYQASTSEMFGKVQATPQDERTPFYPRSPYGAAKLYAHWMTVNYREAYGLPACSGILFNHESPLRGPEFVTRKITIGLARLALGAARPLRLGNLDARRDWGFAGDYVRGIRAMLRQERMADYVLATGETRSVREFVEATAASLGLAFDWQGEGAAEVARERGSGRVLVEIDPAFHRPAEVDLLVGDASRARAALGWAPSVGFAELVGMMAEADARRARDNRWMV